MARKLFKYDLENHVHARTQMDCSETLGQLKYSLQAKCLNGVIYIRAAFKGPPQFLLYGVKGKCTQKVG